jgi:hypothetical protein
MKNLIIVFLLIVILTACSQNTKAKPPTSPYSTSAGITSFEAASADEQILLGRAFNTVIWGCR